MATWLAHSVPIRDTCVCSSKHCPNIFHNSRQPSNNSFSHRLAGELTKTSFPSQVVLLLWVRPFQQSYLCPMRAFLRAWPCSVGHTQAGRCHTSGMCLLQSSSLLGVFLWGWPRTACFYKETTRGAHRSPLCMVSFEMSVLCPAFCV